MEITNNKGINSVTKAFRILEYLSLRNEPCRLTDISHALELPTSTTIRFLSTLISLGYVSQEPVTEKYFATLKLCSLSEKLISTFDICDVARPYVKALSSMCNQTVCLAIEKNRKVTYETILFLSDKQSISSLRRIGQILPYHCTDVGKIFLAAKTKQQIKNIVSSNVLNTYTANTINDTARLHEELLTIKEALCAYDREEFSIGVSGMAVPIYNYSNDVVAALSICGLTSLITPEFQAEYLPALKENANKISASMGASVML